MPENLWASWRMDYIRELAGQPDPSAAQGGAPVCFLCDAAAHAAGTPEARARLVLLHDARGLILLNRYPYTNGHLLVAVDAHLGDLSDLSAQQRCGLMELTAVAQRVLRTAVNPQGFNIGVNIGRCAGAGLPGHMHVHVVPRWSGDSNFMHTVGQVRVIPEALEKSFEQLEAAL